MTGTKAGFYNFVMATAAGAAAAFATFAMPDALLKQELEGWGLALSLDDGVRLGIVALVGAFAFLLAYLSLRACDSRSTGKRLVVLEQPDSDLDFLTDLEPQGAASQQEDTDPFLDLARGAEPVDEPLELEVTQQVLEKRQARRKAAPSAPMNVAEVADMSTQQFLERVATSPKGEETFQGMMQRLNAGLADHEWPIHPEPQEEDAEVRLRDVLQNLKKRAQNG